MFVRALTVATREVKAGMTGKEALFAFCLFVTLLQGFANGHLHIGFEEVAFRVNETNTKIDVCVNVTNPHQRNTNGSIIEDGQTVPVLIQSVSGTAKDPGDFTAIDESITLTSENTRSCIEVSIHDDELFEMDETFSLIMSSSDPSISPSPDEAEITIANDDGLKLELQVPFINYEPSTVMLIEVVANITVEAPISVKIFTLSGTATDGEDYEGFNKTVELNLGETRTNLTERIIDDTIFESSETFFIRMEVEQHPLSHMIENADPQSQVIIFDDDRGTFGFKEVSYSVGEGKSQVIVEIELKTITATDIPIDFIMEFTDETAQRTIDYNAPESISLQIKPGETAIPYSIGIRQNDELEEDETFNLTLTATTTRSSVVTDYEKAVVTITEIVSVTVGFNESSYVVDEAATSVCLSILDGVLAPNRAANVTIQSIDGTAKAPTDYTAVDQVVMLTQENPSTCVDIAIMPDEVLESDETFMLHLTSDIPTVMLQLSETMITISNDDAVTVSFKENMYTYMENEGQADVDVVLTGDTELNVAVTVIGVPPAVSNSAGEFHGSLTFTPGGPKEQTVSSAITDDMIALEDDEITRVSLNIESPGFGVEYGVNQVTDVVIIDDDTHDVVVGFDQIVQDVSESEAGFTACVSILNGTIQHGKEIVVTVVSMNGTATATNDYGVVNEELTLNSSMRTACFDGSVVNENVLDRNESFTLHLTSSTPTVTLQPPTSTITIINDDEVTVSFKQIEYHFSEDSGQAYVEVVLTGETELDVNVTVKGGPSTQTTIGPNRFELSSFVIFTPESSKEMTVYAPIENDMISFEEDEIVLVTLEIVEPGYGVNIVNQVTQVVIFDDDTDDVRIGFNRTMYSVSESESEVQVCVIILQGTLAENKDINVTLGFTDGTAKVNEDYMDVDDSFTLTSTMTSYCIPIPIVQDNVLEVDETFTISLSSSVSSVMLKPNKTMITITNDDAVSVSFKSTQYTYSESDRNAVVEVVLIGDTALNVTVLVEGGPSNEDAIGTDRVVFSNLVTFTPGDPKEITVSTTIVDDAAALEANEIITVQLTIGSPIPDATTGPNSSTTVTILDDDLLSAYFIMPQDTVIENEGMISICLNKSHQTITDVTFDVHTRDGTANDGSDYNLTSSTVTIPKNIAQGCTVVEIKDDDEFENVENFFVVLSYSGTSSITLNQKETEISIYDNDGVTMSFKKSQYTYNENDGSAFVEVVLIGESAVDVTVLVEGGPSNQQTLGADRVQFNTIVTFTPGGVTESTVSVPIVDDTDALEDDETVNVTLTIVTPTSGVIAGPPTTVTIVDNDDVTVGFAMDTYTYDESEGMAVVDVVLTGNNLVDVVVSVSGGPSGQTGISSDKVIFSGDVTFSPGDLKEYNVTADIPDDTIALELDEIVTVDLVVSSPTSRVTTGPISSTTVTIHDDTMLSVYFTAPKVTVNENDGMVEICVGKSLQTIPDVTLNIMARDDTAKAGLDYNLTSSTVTIPANSLTECFYVAIIDDDVPEDTKTFFVDLSYPGTEDQVQVMPSTVEVTILDVSPPITTAVCTLSSDLLLQPFDEPLDGAPINISRGCEHILVKTCKGSATNLEIRVDYKRNDFTSTRVFINYEGEIVTLREDSWTIEPNQTSKLVLYTDTNTMEVSIPQIQLEVIRNKTHLSVTVSNSTSDLQLSGLCGNLNGELVIPDCTDKIDTYEELRSFVNSYKVKPSDQILRPGRKECGIIATDTVLHDPMMTVPIRVPGRNDRKDYYLCYQVHGKPDMTFNFVSDECTTVNAHYVKAPIDGDFNVIESMSIVAVDNQGSCHQISVAVNATTCSARINGNTLDGTTKKRSTILAMYEAHGISIRAYESRVRISVPNCADNSLVMWVICQHEPLIDYEGLETDNVDMIKFEISRGRNLKEYSHGLLGQFWNIPITVNEYPTPEDIDHDYQYYNVTVYHPHSEPRSFSGLLYFLTWDYEQKDCLYVGNIQAGYSPEIPELTGSVIEGSVRDYVMNDPFETEFLYGIFDDTVCP